MNESSTSMRHALAVRLRSNAGLRGWTWVWIALMLAAVASGAASDLLARGAFADAWAHFAYLLTIASAVLGTVIAVVSSAREPEAEDVADGTGGGR